MTGEHVRRGQVTTHLRPDAGSRQSAFSALRDRPSRRRRRSGRSGHQNSAPHSHRRPCRPRRPLYLSTASTAGRGALPRPLELADNGFGGERGRRAPCLGGGGGKAGYCTGRLSADGVGGLGGGLGGGPWGAGGFALADPGGWRITTPPSARWPGPGGGRRDAGLADGAAWRIMTGGAYPSPPSADVESWQTFHPLQQLSKRLPRSPGMDSFHGLFGIESPQNQ